VSGSKHYAKRGQTDVSVARKAWICIVLRLTVFPASCWPESYFYCSVYPNDT